MATTENLHSPVVTRFAPSPTGFLHIGGARTALFNWLFARGNGGKFLLRIEDTDRERHSEDAVQAILDGLSWLGLDWDGNPTSQYERRKRHQEIANELVATGHAYRCYMSQDELAAARDKARAEKIRFESPWQNKSAKDHPDEIPYVIRFNAPQSGVTQIHDAVQGVVSFPNDALDDLILVRSDGNPTYNLAVVVDDHDMGVTHVIRGDDHLNNAARQQQIYNALGWSVPTYAHIPLIHGSDGKKLSKRHGALGVEAYRDDGFLQPALVNYLLRLGWAHGDTDIISVDDAKKWFDLSGVNKAPARLDREKLCFLNKHYICGLADEEFLAQAKPFLKQTEFDDNISARLHRGASFLKDRCAQLNEISEAAAFLLLSRPLEITGKAAKPLKKDSVDEILSAVLEALSADDLWTSAQSLENTIKSFAEAREIGFGAVGAPMRAALTAGHPSPSLGEVLYSLGPVESRARIRDQLA